MALFEENISLSEYTTLGIGGIAKKFSVVNTPEELIAAIKQAKENNWQYKVIGGGSNLLISDEGADIAVIKNNLKGIKQEGLKLQVMTGTLLQELVDYAINQGLAGLQTLTGIPGTVGGAVYGNAGAYGQSISDHLTEVICFDGENTMTLQKKDCQFDYRYSVFKRNGFVVSEAQFTLTEGDTNKLKEEAENIMAKRLLKYPPKLKCPGSFFKNVIIADLPKEIVKNIPPEYMMYGKIPAGVLLDAVGAKGDHLGDIRIAENHGNTFINNGKGSAKDFYELAQKYAQRVYEKFSIKLEPEVQLINLPPFTFTQ